MAKKDKTTGSKGVVASALSNEQAVSQLVQWLTRVPDLDEVLRKAGIKRHQLSALLYDDEIDQAVETRIDALLAVPFRLSPSEGPAADFLIDQLSRFIKQITKSAIKARFYGYNVQEAVYQQGEDGYYGLQNIIEKPMEWFEPKNNGELRYFPDSGLGGVQGVLVDQEFKFFLTTNDPTYKQPQGKALLSRLYWPWYFRTNGWKFWAKFLERFGSPMLVGETEGEIQEMQAGLLAAHGSAVVTINKGDSVSAIGAGGNGGQTFESFDNALTRRINKLVLGQTLTSGTDGGGSRALGQIHNEVRTDKRDSDIQLVLPTIQHVINALCTLNSLEPHTVILADGKGLEKERAERDKSLHEQGVRFTRKYYEDEYNLEAEHFDINSDKPAPVFSAVPKQQFKFSASNITAEQQQIDNLAPKSYSLLDAGQIKSIIADCDNAEQLAEKLFSTIPDASIGQFNDVLSEALYIADLLGYKHSGEGN